MSRSSFQGLGGWSELTTSTALEGMLFSLVKSHFFWTNVLTCWNDRSVWVFMYGLGKTSGVPCIIYVAYFMSWDTMCAWIEGMQTQILVKYARIWKYLVDNLVSFFVKVKQFMQSWENIIAFIWNGLRKDIGMNQIWSTTHFFEASLNIRRCLLKFCLIFTLWLSSVSVGHL